MGASRKPSERSTPPTMSLTAASKIQKVNGEPSELETEVAKALHDLQVAASSKDLGEALRTLHIVSSRQVDVPGGRQAIVVFVPFRLHAAFKQIQQRLIRELEKKFAKVVAIIAQRRVLKKPLRSNQKKQQKRPRSLHHGVQEADRQARRVPVPDAPLMWLGCAPPAFPLGRLALRASGQTGMQGELFHKNIMN